MKEGSAGSACTKESSMEKTKSRQGKGKKSPPFVMLDDELWQSDAW